MTSSPTDKRREDARYVLLTQCLQNDLFGNRNCSLGLPDPVVRMMLLGKRRFEFDQGEDGHRRLPQKVLARGPLGLFLGAAIGRRLTGAERHGTLHVINIRDWHEPGRSYDAERQLYGRHCEAGTWGADYLDGLEQFLDPLRAPADQEARYSDSEHVRIHHVHSDSLFDFKPRSQTIKAGARKFQAAELEDLLDVIVEGSDHQLEELREVASKGNPARLADLARRARNGNGSAPPELYVAVIGVYTDIKVKTLLTGLRTRYNLPNLAVSDTFTASSTSR
jgi:hypothetical protein